MKGASSFLEGDLCLSFFFLSLLERHFVFTLALTLTTSIKLWGVGEGGTGQLLPLRDNLTPVNAIRRWRRECSGAEDARSPSNTSLHACYQQRNKARKVEWRVIAVPNGRGLFRDGVETEVSGNIYYPSIHVMVTSSRLLLVFEAILT